MLTAADVKTFETEGYLVVEDVIDPDLLARVRAEYAARLQGLYDGWVRKGAVPGPDTPQDFWAQLDHAVAAGVEWFQPLDISLPHDGITTETPYHFGPAVFDLLTHAPVLDCVEQLIGGELTSNPIQHVRIKPPQRNVAQDEVRAHITETAWHQDRGVTLAEADQTQMVTVWIAITDASVENGCLQVIPNPPEDMLPHCPQRQTALAPGQIDEARAVPAEVKAGGIVMIHPLTPHGAGPNTSDGYRWSFDIRYNVTGQPTGRSQFPDFVARSRSAPQTELRDWQTWVELWDQTRLTLAYSAHIPQHRWPADSPFCA